MLYPFLLVGTVTASYLVYNAIANETRMNPAVAKDCAAAGFVQTLVSAGPFVAISYSLSCINQFIGNTVSTLLRPMRDMMKQITSITSLLQQRVSGLQQMSLSLQRLMVGVVAEIKARVDQSLGIVGWLVKRVMQIFVRLFQLFVSVFRIFLGILYYLLSVKNMMGDFINIMKKAFGNMDKVANKLGQEFTKFGGAVSKSMNTMATDVDKGFRKMDGVMQDKMRAVGGAVDEQVNVVKGEVAAQVRQIKQQLNATGAAVEGVGKKVADVTMTTTRLDKVLSGVTNVKSFITSETGKVISSVDNQLAGMVGTVSNRAFDKAKDYINSKLGGNKIKSVASDTTKKVGNAVSSTASKTSKGASNAIKKVKKIKI